MLPPCARRRARSAPARSLEHQILLLATRRRRLAELDRLHDVRVLELQAQRRLVGERAAQLLVRLDRAEDALMQRDRAPGAFVDREQNARHAAARDRLDQVIRPECRHGSAFILRPCGSRASSAVGPRHGGEVGARATSRDVRAATSWVRAGDARRRRAACSGHSSVENRSR